MRPPRRSNLVGNAQEKIMYFCKYDKDQIQLKYDTLRLLCGCRRSALPCLGHWLCCSLAAFTARACLAASPGLTLSDAPCRVNLHNYFLVFTTNLQTGKREVFSLQPINGGGNPLFEHKQLS